MVKSTPPPLGLGGGLKTQVRTIVGVPRPRVALAGILLLLVYTVTAITRKLARHRTCYVVASLPVIQRLLFTHIPFWSFGRVVVALWNTIELRARNIFRYLPTYS